MSRTSSTGIVGLKFMRRDGDRVDAYWHAPERAAKLGFRPRTKRVWKGCRRDDAPMDLIGAECSALQQSFDEWMCLPPEQRRPQEKRFRRSRASAGWIYFVRADNLIKIGFTGTLPKRFRQLQCMSAVKLRLLCALRGASDLEVGLHVKFQHLHSHGEWFHAAPDLIQFVEEQKEKAAKVTPFVTDTEHRDVKIGNSIDKSMVQLVGVEPTTS